MQRIMKRYKLWGILLFTLLTAGIMLYAKPLQVHAATTGFQVIGGKTYYIDSDGKKHKGWLTLNGKKYYFNARTGVQAKGWVTNSKGQKRYFSKSTGAMVTGWLKNSKGQKRYFDPSTGIMKTKWATIGGKRYYMNASTGYATRGWTTDSKGQKRYFNQKTAVMSTGWVTFSGNVKRYFSTSNGVMLTGFQRINGKTYYFHKSTGKMRTGWISNSKGDRYYFDTSTGVMATGTQVIGGVTYTFNSSGVLISSNAQPDTAESTGSKTIKNYLAGALKPVGQALYVWGGGWNDSTRKGVSPTWKQWYDSQNSSYDYHNYNDLSTANRAKGLDCSGFVGWAAYQVMHSQSGVGSGYTVVASDVGSYYASKGWGTIYNQSKLSSSSWVLKPGDVGYNSGHTWIVLGQCSDKSVVIVHSTPNAGCQIAGTPTPSGDYSSQAVTLAKKYMSKYAGFTKYDYHTSTSNYIRNGNYLRWNRSTLADPNGYMNKTADQILADLFK